MERFSLSSREKKVESMVKSNKKSENGLVVIKTPGDFLFNQCLSLGSGIFSSTGEKVCISIYEVLFIYLLCNDKLITLPFPPLLYSL